MEEPQSWVRVGSSTLDDADRALEEALDQLRLEYTPRLLIVLAAPRYPLEGLADGVQQRVPGCDVIGCTTSGEIAPAGALTQALVLWALGGTEVRVSTAGGRASSRACARPPQRRPVAWSDWNVASTR